MTSKVNGCAVGGGRLARAVVALSLAVLAACGGGSQVERFVPARMIALGDENNLIEADGSKYTVNALTTATPAAPDCTVNLLWIQIVAGQYGLRFPRCLSGAASTSSGIYASNLAKVSDLPAQIAAAGPLGATDLVSVFVGANDIFDLYAGCNGCDVTALLARAGAAGTALAAQLAAITKQGAKVVFLTIPELGSTPYARDQEALHPGAAALLTNLTVAFNTKLRTGVSNQNSPSFIDGHQGVQVLADDLFRPIVAAGSTTTGYLNVVDGICNKLLAATVLQCNTNTLLLGDGTTTPVLTAGGTPGNYLWADDKHLSPGGHSTLGSTAAARVNANPL